MLFFKKRKKDEEEEEDLDEDELKEKSKKKRKPRKKKEPPKQWGKKERLIILVVFFITVVTSGLLSLRSNNWQLPGFSRLGLSKPEISLFEEKNIVLYGTQDENVEASVVNNQFLKKTNYLQGNYAFYVVRLVSGYNYGVEKDKIMPAASLIKLPVMLAMYIEEENGNLDLDETYTLQDEDKISGAGSLANQPAGYEIKYRDLIKLMGKQSDNTAFNIARKKIGDQKINQTIDDIGMLSTSLENNETTPTDIGIFFERLWSGDLISPVNKEELLFYLTDTEFEDWLAAGIPENVKVAHKYGVLSDVVNDAGIIYTNEPFVMVLMSERVNREEANGILPELSRLIYEHELRKN